MILGMMKSTIELTRSVRMTDDQPLIRTHPSPRQRAVRPRSLQTCLGTGLRTTSASKNHKKKVDDHPTIQHLDLSENGAYWRSSSYHDEPWWTSGIQGWPIFRRSFVKHLGNGLFGMIHSIWLSWTKGSWKTTLFLGMCDSEGLCLVEDVFFSIVKRLSFWSPT